MPPNRRPPTASGSTYKTANQSYNFLTDALHGSCYAQMQSCQQAANQGGNKAPLTVDACNNQVRFSLLGERLIGAEQDSRFKLVLLRRADRQGGECGDTRCLIEWIYTISAVCKYICLLCCIWLCNSCNIRCYLCCRLKPGVPHYTTLPLQDERKSRRYRYPYRPKRRTVISPLVGCRR